MGQAVLPAEMAVHGSLSVCLGPQRLNELPSWGRSQYTHRHTHTHTHTHRVTHPLMSAVIEIYSGIS